MNGQNELSQPIYENPIRIISSSNCAIILQMFVEKIYIFDKLNGNKLKQTIFNMLELTNIKNENKYKINNCMKIPENKIYILDLSALEQIKNNVPHNFMSTEPLEKEIKNRSTLISHKLSPVTHSYYSKRIIEIVNQNNKFNLYVNLGNNKIIINNKIIFYMNINHISSSFLKDYNKYYIRNQKSKDEYNKVALMLIYNACIDILLLSYTISRKYYDMHTGLCTNDKYFALLALDFGIDIIYLKKYYKSSNQYNANKIIMDNSLSINKLLDVLRYKLNYIYIIFIGNIILFL